MKILMIASKSPWPPIDGGRLAMMNTILALHEIGHQVHLIAPRIRESDDELKQIQRKFETIAGIDLVPVKRRSIWSDVIVSWIGKTPLTVVRHRHAELHRVIWERINSIDPDVIHAEQLQAFANVNLNSIDKIPVILRMQNVESELWTQTGRARWWHWPLRWEAMRLRKCETRALELADWVIAITEIDAQDFRSRLAPESQTKVCAWPPPFEMELPSAPSLQGSPCVVLSGSTGWWPNFDAIQWFVRDVLPELSRRLPEAVVHVFGDVPTSHPQIIVHDSPIDAIEAFPANAICAVPLRVGSGIRMRILEAFARGLPVVTTSRGANGLWVQPGNELMIADTADVFVSAIEKLHRDHKASIKMIDAGRAYLALHHEAQSLGEQLSAWYQQAIENCKRRGPKSNAKVD